MKLMQHFIPFNEKYMLHNTYYLHRHKNNETKIILIHVFSQYKCYMKGNNNVLITCTSKFKYRLNNFKICPIEV